MKGTLKQLDRAIEHAETYEEWYEASREYDRLSGADEWKEIDRSPHYDYELIRNRLWQIRQARERHDVNKLVFHLHEGLHGNLGNISNPRLYQQTRVGTKRLIENYLEEVTTALNYLCDTNFKEFGLKEKLDFFETTGQAFGQSCLMLSGGAALGLFHIGVARCLWEQGLLPSVISGSSAGSIIASVVGTHNDEELKLKLEPENIYLEAFKVLGWKGIVRGTPVLDGDHLEACLEENILDMTFEEAYRHTGREINITVSPYDRNQHARLLNWRTSPNVLIRKASLASCAIPGISPPVSLWAKNIDGERVPYIPGRKFVDGSIVDDLPIRRLSRLYGVNHSIVSQTNPHVVPFLTDRGQDEKLSLTNLPSHLLKSEIQFHGQGVFDYLRKRVRPEILRQLSGQMYTIMAQRYSGDVTIAPNYSLRHFRRMLANPSPEYVREMILEGERATWPKISMIRSHARISKTLERCVRRLKQQNRRAAELKLVSGDTPARP